MVQMLYTQIQQAPGPDLRKVGKSMLKSQQKTDKNYLKKNSRKVYDKKIFKVFPFCCYGN